MNIDRINELIKNMHTLGVNVRQHMNKNLIHIKPDLTYEMLKILLLLSHRNELNQQQLAELTSKNKASITSLIDNLEKRKLVIRTQDEVDKRNKQVMLTEDGIKIVDVIQPLFDEMFSRLYNNVSVDEIELMNRLVLKMNENIK